MNHVHSGKFLSRRADDLATKGHDDALRDVEAKVDREAAALWDVAQLELAAMRAALQRQAAKGRT